MASLFLETQIKNDSFQIDESAPINQVDHLICESTKIVEMKLPQDDVDSITTSTEVNKELLLPPTDVLIKDSLKFVDSESEEVDVLGFELQQTESREEDGVVVEEKVQKVEEEPTKDKDDKEDEW